MGRLGRAPREALALAAALALWAAGAPSEGAADDPCGGFKWPLARERAWLTGPLDDRAAIDPGGGGVRLHLAEVGSVRFDVPPERAPSNGTTAGLLRLEHVAAGIYQVTLSDEAWIDVVQGGSRVPSIDFSSVKGCQGMRKSVRFRLSDGPATVQISGARGVGIAVAVAPIRLEPP